MENKETYSENLNQVKEEQPGYVGFVNKSEDEKPKENIFRSPIEKLRLFTRMLRRETVLKNAKTTQR